jgi:hypothetical protein
MTEFCEEAGLGGAFGAFCDDHTGHHHDDAGAPPHDHGGTPPAASAVATAEPNSSAIIAGGGASDPCVADPTAAACASYTYPAAAVTADITSLCNSMPDMPGCSLSRSCQVRMAEAAAG